MKYAVHLFRLVRVKVADVEAATFKEAMQKADRATESQEMFRNMALPPACASTGVNVEFVEWAESITERACVTPILEDGEVDHGNTCYLDSDGEPLLYA